MIGGIDGWEGTRIFKSNNKYKNKSSSKNNKKKKSEELKDGRKVRMI